MLTGLQKPPLSFDALAWATLSGDGGGVNVEDGDDEYECDGVCGC